MFKYVNLYIYNHNYLYRSVIVFLTLQIVIMFEQKDADNTRNFFIYAVLQRSITYDLEVDSAMSIKQQLILNVNCGLECLPMES